MDDKKLELLLAYTTFHIGVYLTLTTVLIGASILRAVNHPLIRWAVGCFLVAGASGGIIAANVAERGDSSATFFAAGYRLSIWGVQLFPLHLLTTVEHLAFWTGILPISLVFLFRGGAHFKAA
jgi:general stress protein CsbA